MSVQHADTKQSAIRRQMIGGASAQKEGVSPALSLAERAEAFGLGACSCKEEYEIPANWNLDMLRCQYDRLPNSVVVPGNTAVQLIIQPTVGSTWFCPVAWTSTVRDSVDPQLARDVWITDVTIGPCTLMPFSDRAPTLATTTQFMWASELDPAARDNCACPTPNWPCHSNVANNCTLQITLFNPNPAGIDARVSVEVLGKAIPSCFDWRNPGKTGSVPRSPSAMPV